MKKYIILFTLITTITYSQESQIPTNVNINTDPAIQAKAKKNGVGPTYNFHFYNGQQTTAPEKPQKIKPLPTPQLTTAPVVVQKAPESPFEFHNIEIGFHSFADHYDVEHADGMTFSRYDSEPSLTLTDQVAIGALYKISKKFFLTPAIIINDFEGNLSSSDLLWKGGGYIEGFRDSWYEGTVPGIKLGLRYLSNPERGWGFKAGVDAMYAMGDVESVYDGRKQDITSLGYNAYVGGQYAFKYLAIGMQFGTSEVKTKYKDHSVDHLTTNESTGALTVSFAI